MRTLHGDSVRSAVFDDADLQLERWYHLALSHSNNERTPWAKSEVRLHIDGQAAGRAALKYSTFASLPLAAIGANVVVSNAPPALGLDTAHALDGQLGVVYVFDEVLSADELSRLHALGPNYAGTFRDASVLERAAPRLFLAYHCSATTDAAPLRWQVPSTTVHGVSGSGGGVGGSQNNGDNNLDNNTSHPAHNDFNDPDERDSNRRPMWCVDLAVGEKVNNKISRNILIYSLLKKAKKIFE